MLTTWAFVTLVEFGGLSGCLRVPMRCGLLDETRGA